MKVTPRQAALLAAALLAPTAAAAAGPVGKWRVGDGSAVIALRSCGAGICGFIDTISERGGTDENNPDPALRSRPLVGLQIMSVQKTAENLWSGTVYNAKNGQNYFAKLKQTGDGALTLEGCVAATNLCGEDQWSRVR